MTDHAAVAPSSAAMWMNCPASITKAAGRTRPSSKYAREGTAAHKIAEMIIQGNMFPPGKITVEGEQFIVGLPMLKALNPYIGLVQSLRGLGETYIEAKVHLNCSTGLVWGTTDCVTKVGDVIWTVDLKYGTGVPVAPDSDQLKIYTLAAIDTFWPSHPIDLVNLTVVQPRLNPEPQLCIMAASDLLQWRDRKLIPAIERIHEGSEIEKVGTYCRWCVRKADCDSFKHYKSLLAADIFDDGLDVLNS